MTNWNFTQNKRGAPSGDVHRAPQSGRAMAGTQQTLGISKFQTTVHKNDFCLKSIIKLHDDDDNSDNEYAKQN